MATLTTPREVQEPVSQKPILINPLDPHVIAFAEGIPLPQEGSAIPMPDAINLTALAVDQTIDAIERP